MPMIGPALVLGALSAILFCSMPFIEVAMLKQQPPPTPAELVEIACTERPGDAVNVAFDGERAPVARSCDELAKGDVARARYVSATLRESRWLSLGLRVTTVTCSFDREGSPQASCVESTKAR